MSRNIYTGEELYNYLQHQNQYKAFSIEDCEKLIRCALHRRHSSLYVTDTYLLIYDCWDGCFCTNPINLLVMVNRMVKEEMNLLCVHSGKYAEILRQDLADLDVLNNKFLHAPLELRV